MSEHHLYEAYGANPAQNYERFFVPAIGAPVAAQLVHRATVQPGERVLDVACGTGVVARLVAERAGDAGRIAALDLNPGMLAVGRSAAAPDAEIEWYEGDAQEMPLPDKSFDVVLCQMGLQFMPDKPAALREMRRVLVPDGRLLLNMPGPAGPLFAILEQAMERHVGPEAAGFVRQVFSLHDVDEVEALISGAGFHDVQVGANSATLRLPPSKEFLWQYVQSTPLSGLVAGAPEDAREALERDVLAEWRELEEDGALVGAQRMVVATARA